MTTKEKPDKPFNGRRIRKYPDELTPSQFDGINWDFTKQFGLYDDRSIDEIAKDVYEFAKKTGYQIYTQVDGDKNIVYSKGLRFVNRIGLYEVVHVRGLKVDNS